MRYDAVILAGGRATRLGGASKPTLAVGGTRLLDSALAATTGADRTVVVGPSDLAASTPPDVAVTREDPAFGGPVAGIDAGLAALRRPGAPTHVLVLAVDVPGAATAATRLLAEPPGRTDGVHLTRRGRAQWLTGLYRRAALERGLRRLEPHDAPVRRLMATLTLRTVADETGVSDDVDTWDDVIRLSAPRAGATTQEGST